MKDFLFVFLPITSIALFLVFFIAILGHFSDHDPHPNDKKFDSMNSYSMPTNGDDWVISINGSGWIMPAHFKDPTHWMYIPVIEE